MNIKNFDGFIGNNQAVSHLKKSLSSRQVSHFYVFAGGFGVGKKTLARLFAKAVMCEKGESEPCGTCLSCRLADSGNHPDITYIQQDKKKSTSIDTVRDAILSDINIKPYKASHKIYIIEKSDRLTIAAQNALLKTLEEPPKYGVFILCAENLNLLLPTILSRCVVIKLKPLPSEDVTRYLLKNVSELTPQKAEFFARLSLGFLGQALEYCQKISEDGIPLVITIRNILLSLLQKITKKQPWEIILKTKELEAYKEEVDLILNLIQVWYRDIAVLKECGSKYLIQYDILDKISDETKNIPSNTLINTINAVETAKFQLNSNAGFIPVLETLFFKLRNGGIT